MRSLSFLLESKGYVVKKLRLGAGLPCRCPVAADRVFDR
jgi:hypothetical protein